MVFGSVLLGLAGLQQVSAEHSFGEVVSTAWCRAGLIQATVCWSKHPRFWGLGNYPFSLYWGCRYTCISCGWSVRAACVLPNSDGLFPPPFLSVWRVMHKVRRMVGFLISSWHVWWLQHHVSVWGSNWEWSPPRGSCHGHFLPCEMAEPMWLQSEWSFQQYIARFVWAIKNECIDILIDLANAAGS